MPRLWIGNLSPVTTNAKLEAWFAAWKVEVVAGIAFDLNGDSRGFGWVDLAAHAEPLALTLHGKTVDYNKITVRRMQDLGKKTSGKTRQSRKAEAAREQGNLAFEG